MKIAKITLCEEEYKKLIHILDNYAVSSAPYETTDDMGDFDLLYQAIAHDVSWEEDN